MFALILMLVCSLAANCYYRQTIAEYEIKSMSMEFLCGLLDMMVVGSFFVLTIVTISVLFSV
jgi:hypothetical protein